MNCYSADTFINTGFGGTVHAAVKRATGERVAIKKMSRKGPNAWAAAREVYFARRLRHKNIIVTHEVIETGSSINLVQELADHGDLYDFIQLDDGGCGKAEMKEIFQQVVSAVDYMHAKGYCHRDIKPENIVLFNEGGRQLAKLIDFGLAEPSCWVSARVGSDGYAAPEVTAIKPGQTVDGRRADVFSLGVLLHALLAGRMCWSEASMSDPEYRAYLEAREAGTIGACFGSGVKGLNISKDLCVLLDAMLDPVPSHRPTTTQMLQLLPLMAWFRANSKGQDTIYANALIWDKDSGCSWGDDLDDGALDFNAMPLPSFRDDVLPSSLCKCDSGVWQ